MEISILKDKNPAIAGFVESWKKKYEKKFDLKDSEQQAIFYEGMLELARFVAKSSESASLRTTLCTSGISEVIIAIMPSDSSAS
jgi:hypothetical protein